MSAQSRHISFDWETLLGPDEHFTTPSATATTPSSAAAISPHSAVTTNAVTATAGGRRESDASGGPSGRRGDRNKRQTKRAQERRNQRPESPFGRIMCGCMFYVNSVSWTTYIS